MSWRTTAAARSTSSGSRYETSSSRRLVGGLWLHPGDPHPERSPATPHRGGVDHASPHLNPPALDGGPVMKTTAIRLEDELYAQLTIVAQLESQTVTDAIRTA